MADNTGMVIAHARNLHWLDEFGLGRGEFVLMESEARNELERFISDRKLPFSAHVPVFKPEDHPGNNALLACLVDWDEPRRLESLRLMEKNIGDALALGAEYVVAHIQRPENYGGLNPEGFSAREALDSAKEGCEQLLRRAAAGGMPVYIENLFRNSSFFAPETSRALLDSFPELGFCLDIGHLDVDAREFGFPFEEYLDAVMPYLRAVHLQNSNPAHAGGSRTWKIPVHPSQTEAEGWRDIEKILRKILAHNPRCIINFEQRMNVPEELEMIREGIEWVKKLIPEILSQQVQNKE